MTKVIVLTDFSTTAKISTNVAINLSVSSNCELHFFHTILTPIDWVKLNLDKENLYPEVKEKIAQAKSELNKIKTDCEHKGVKCSSHLTFNRGGENLTEYIHHNNYGLVVMGSHGINGVEKVIGTNTTQVINQVTTPVMVVKNQTSESLIKHVIIYFQTARKTSNTVLDVINTGQFGACKFHLVYDENQGADYRSNFFEFHKKLMSTYPEMVFEQIKINETDLWPSVFGYVSLLEDPMIVLDENMSLFDVMSLKTKSHVFKLMNHPTIPVLCL